MRPLRVMSLQNEHGLEFKTVCVLDLLSDFPNPTRTQLIVDECAKDKVSSGASTHKKLGELKEKGFVKEHVHAEDKDGRRRYIQITDAGMQFLKQWEGKLAHPEWVGLTKEEFEQSVDGLEDLEDCWVQIEAKLREKNT